MNLSPREKERISINVIRRLKELLAEQNGKKVDIAVRVSDEENATTKKKVA